MHKYIKEIFILLVGVVGMCLSLILKRSYIGDAATWFGGCASTIAVLFAYMQFDNAERQLKEMKKENDLKYLPELTSISKPRSPYLKTDGIINTTLSRFTFKIRNMGVKAALNIKVSYFVDDNVEDIKKFLSKYSPNGIITKYHDPHGEEMVSYYNKNWPPLRMSCGNFVNEQNISYLENSKNLELVLPSSYLIMVNDYFEEMNCVKEHKSSNDIEQFPSLKIRLSYEDLQGKHYSKEMEATVKLIGYTSINNKEYPRVLYNVFNLPEQLKNPVSGLSQR